MCMHDGQAHAWRGMHLEVRGQPSPLSCWDLMVSLVSATACYRLSGLWTPVNFWVIPTSALSILPQECWIADVDHWIQLPPPPPPHTHCLIRLLDLYSKHFYPWTIFLTPGVRFFSFSTCLLWKGWLYHDLCLWGWWTACRSWFSPIIEDSGIKHVVGLGDKYPFLLSLLTGPRYSVSQVSFRSLHFFFFLGMCPFHST